VERDDGELEADAAEQHDDAEDDDGVGAGEASRQDGGEAVHGHLAGLRVDQRHAEHEERRGGAGQHQVLHGGLDEALAIDRVDDKRVQGDAEDLEPKEERGEVRAGHQRGSAKGGREQQHVVLLRRYSAALQVAVGDEGHRRRGAGEQADVQQGVLVHREQRGDLGAGLPGGDEQRTDGRRQPGQREHQRQQVRAVEGGREHHDHRRQCEHQQGQQGDEVGRLH
jgi:hypothetical protein